MAISVTTNPFIIDAISATALVTKQFNVIAIRWTSGSLADTAVLQDQNANPIWQSVGTIANNVEQSNFPVDRPLTFNGLKVPTLGAGTIFIYTKENDPV